MLVINIKKKDKINFIQLIIYNQTTKRKGNNAKFINYSF